MSTLGVATKTSIRGAIMSNSIFIDNTFNPFFPPSSLFSRELHDLHGCKIYEDSVRLPAVNTDMPNGAFIFSHCKSGDDHNCELLSQVGSEESAPVR